MRLLSSRLLLSCLFVWLSCFPLNASGVKGLSEREAVDCVRKKVTLPKPERNRFVEVDRVESRNGRRYYVVHGYHNVIDDPKTKEGHTATFGWYFVDCASGSVFALDLATDRLVPPRR